MENADIVHVVTLNTWKNDGDLRRRLPAMAQGLRALTLDIVLLQEVFRADEPTWHTGEALADALGLVCVYAPARRKFRAWDGRVVTCEAGLAILWRGERPAAETIALPTSEAGGERIALLCRGEIRGRRVLAGNVHLSHLRGDDDGRRAQLAATLAAPTWQTSAHLRILGGDFNATAALAASIDGSVALHNVFDGTPGCPPTHPLPPRAGRFGRTIDLLFSVTTAGERPAKVAQAFVALDRPDADGVWPSDHAAVGADLCV